MEELESFNSITLVGYYGKNNLGDDLMLASLLEEFPNHQIKILAFDKLIGFDEYKNINEVHIWPNMKRKKMQTFLRAIKGSEAVVWGGGTCFTDEDGDGFFKYMPIAKTLGKKIIYTGVGVGNLKRKNRKLKADFLIKIADFLSLRDEKSYQYVKNVKGNEDKISLVRDPSIKYLQSHFNNDQFGSLNTDTLLIGWRNLEKYKDTQGNNLNNLIREVDSLIERYSCKKVIIMDVDSSYDPIVSGELFERLKGNKSNIEIIYDKESDFKAKMSVILNSRVVITSRLHLGVVCDLANISCYIYNYSPKIEYLWEESDSQSLHLISKDFNIVKKEYLTS